MKFDCKSPIDSSLKEGLSECWWLLRNEHEQCKSFRITFWTCYLAEIFRPKSNKLFEWTQIELLTLSTSKEESYHTSSLWAPGHPVTVTRESASFIRNPSKMHASMSSSLSRACWGIGLNLLSTAKSSALPSWKRILRSGTRPSATWSSQTKFGNVLMLRPRAKPWMK